MTSFTVNYEGFILHIEEIYNHEEDYLRKYEAHCKEVDYKLYWDTTDLNVMVYEFKEKVNNHLTNRKVEIEELKANYALHDLEVSSPNLWSKELSGLTKEKVEKKAKKKEKFYRKLVDKLSKNIPGLHYNLPYLSTSGHDGTHSWAYDDEINRRGFTTYKELAKDIMKHLRIKGEI